MSHELQRANSRFIAVAVALIAAMALFFLLLAWGVGGTEFFRDDLLGYRFAPIFGLLMILAALVAYLLSDKPRASGSGKEVPRT